MEIFTHPTDENMCPYPKYGSLSLASEVVVDGTSKQVSQMSFREACKLIEQRHGIEARDIFKPMKKDITHILGTKLNLAIFILLYMEGESADDLIEEMYNFGVGREYLYPDNIQRFFKRHASDKCAERRRCLRQARQMHRLWEYYTGSALKENQKVLEDFLGGVTFVKLVDLFDRWNSYKKGHGSKEGLFLALDALIIALSDMHFTDFPNSDEYLYAYKRFIKPEVKKRVKAYVRDRKSKTSLV